jgi:diaminohydroxyphosphoribosylaminopyrimidine deaminase / 5-amino-6-(5-phosphoribosylamino)uracil reductase
VQCRKQTSPPSARFLSNLYQFAPFRRFFRTSDVAKLQHDFLSIRTCITRVIIRSLALTVPELTNPIHFESDVAVMRHAVSIARRGIGAVEPNPPVGAVVVSPTRSFIAEGWHHACGQAHAEVNAIASAGDQCAGNDLFVTLEPCCHHGQTPPCVDAVIAAGFRRVVIGCKDPARHANGNGADKLRNAGLEVIVGICPAETQRLIAPFRTLHTLNRPWVHAKWAMTLDGRIATYTGHSKWISGSLSRQYVHQLRGRMDVILTGAGTVSSDDPLLTARPAGQRVAARAVLDSTGESLTGDCQLIRTAATIPVIVFLTDRSSQTQREQLRRQHIDVCEVAADASGRPLMRDVLAELGRRQFTNLLVESGPGVMGSFLDADLIDEVHVFVAPTLVGGHAAFGPIGGQGAAQIPELPRLANVSTRSIASDLLIEGDVVHSGAPRKS